MGSNIHLIVKGDAEPFPERFGIAPGFCTMPRWVGGWDYMKAVYDNSLSNHPCDCSNQNNHDYYCVPDSEYRPKDFDKFRADTIDLPDIFKKITDYLERNPNVWLNYD